VAQVLDFADGLVQVKEKDGVMRGPGALRGHGQNIGAVESIAFRRLHPAAAQMAGVISMVIAISLVGPRRRQPACWWNFPTEFSPTFF